MILDVQRTKPSFRHPRAAESLARPLIIFALCKNDIQSLREEASAQGPNHVFVRTDCEGLPRLLAEFIEKKELTMEEGSLLFALDNPL